MAQRVSGLFHQHMYNRAIEIGQPVHAKQVPVHWARQTKPSGAMDRSLLRIFAGHTKRVESVAFSPNGKQVLTGSDDCTARLWESSSGKELTCFQGHMGWVSSVAFPPMVGLSSPARLIAPHGCGRAAVAKNSPASKVTRTWWKVWHFPLMASRCLLAHLIGLCSYGRAAVAKN